MQLIIKKKQLIWPFISTEVLKKLYNESINLMKFNIATDTGCEYYGVTRDKEMPVKY